MAIVVSEKEKKLAVKLAIILIVFIGAVYASDYYVGIETTAQVRTNNELSEEEGNYRKRLAEIQDEERLQNQYVESYLAYTASGLIVGEEIASDDVQALKGEEEQRLGLLERLQQIQSDRKFFNVQTSLTRPENLPSTFSQYTEESNVAVRTNQMQITFEMLHGLDMLMLLGDFYDDETNRFVPVSCEITRTVSAGELNAEALLQPTAKLLAKCDLVWLTVFDPLQGKGDRTEADS